MRRRETSRTDLRAASVTYGAASVVGMITGLLALDGCQSIKSIVEVGAELGVVVVLPTVAIIGGVIDFVTRKWVRVATHASRSYAHGRARKRASTVSDRSALATVSARRS